MDTGSQFTGNAKIGGGVDAFDFEDEATAPCAVCGTQTGMCCSGCEAVFYCCGKCQQLDWRHHRRVCSRQALLQPSPSRDDTPGEAPTGCGGVVMSPKRNEPINGKNPVNGSPAIASAFKLHVDSVHSEQMDPPSFLDKTGASTWVRDPTNTAVATMSGDTLEMDPSSIVTQTGGSEPVLPSSSEALVSMEQEFGLPTASSANTSREVAAASRTRQLQLRASAVLASKESRYPEAMRFGAEAYEAGQNSARCTAFSSGGAVDTLRGQPEAEATALAEALIVCRAAFMERDFATGVSFLQIVLESTDRLAGTGGAGAFLVPSVAAMVLCSVAELCFNYEQRENAEGYAHAFLDAARQAHGEGSAVVGDAHCLILGMLVKWGRLEEALSHAKMLVEIRRRQSQRIRNDKSLANAHWNLALLSFQVDQNDELTLPSLRAAREIHCQIDGESTKTAEIDVAMGTTYRARGDYKTAVRLYRTAMRERQRFLGFAHPDTRHLASLLDSTEIEMRNSMENTRNDDKIEVASYTKGGESHGSDKRTNNDQKYHF